MSESYSPENAILGCILVGDNEGEILGQLEADWFAREETRELYETLRARWHKDGRVDPMCIPALPVHLRNFAILCMETLPSLSNWAHYIVLMRECAAKNTAMGLAMQIVSGQLELSEMQQKANELLRATNGSSGAQSLNMRDAMLLFMEENQRPRSYLKTGYGKLDKYTFIDRGDYVIVGGRPSSGKTAFTTALALNFAKTGEKVAYFSLETSLVKLKDRFITSYCTLDYDNVKRHSLMGEWENVARNSEAFSALPIELIHASGKSATWMQAEAVRRGAKVAIIDYIGLIRSEGNSRYEKMTNISMALHEFAQQTGVVVIGLSQLSRPQAGRTGGRPGMEALRESGQIEQDADVILLLHRETSGDGSKDDFSVIIEKNKEGRVGEIKMDFDGQHQQFYEIVTHADI